PPFFKLLSIDIGQTPSPRPNRTRATVWTSMRSSPVRRRVIVSPPPPRRKPAPRPGPPGRAHAGPAIVAGRSRPCRFPGFGLQSESWRQLGPARGGCGGPRGVALLETALSGLPRRRGKVRDVYD